MWNGRVLGMDGDHEQVLLKHEQVLLVSPMYYTFYRD